MGDIFPNQEGGQRPPIFVHFGILSVQWTKWTDIVDKVDIFVVENLQSFFLLCEATQWTYVIVEATLTSKNTIH